MSDKRKAFEEKLDAQINELNAYTGYAAAVRLSEDAALLNRYTSK